MYYVYILYSLSLDKYYIGQTQDLNHRIFRHTNSGSKSTKGTNDWLLKHHESFDTRGEATKRESEIKKKKSRKYLEWLINQTSTAPLGV